MFSAAVIPIIIMGTILEIAKVSVTVWLHHYWKFCRPLMKLYLVPAVLMLMLITSMGTYGYLAKAHLDQGIPSGDIAARVALLDEKIKTERDNIETSHRALAQMDASVDQTLARTTDDKGASRAVSIRKSQMKERNGLQKEIADSQAKIANLNEERAPIASQMRKAEAEVGPLKYVAALIYGDNPDSNLLERAIRWVIIILVIVFDPLAIMMVLAANESMKWEKKSIPAPIEEVEPTTEDHGDCPKCGSKLLYASGIGPFCNNHDCDVIDNILNWDQPRQSVLWNTPDGTQIVTGDNPEPETDTTPSIGSIVNIPGVGENQKPNDDK